MEQVPDLFDLLTFSPPREVNTKHGPRLLSKASPEDAFWPLWERFQPQYRMLGFSLSKDLQTQKPTVCHWAEIPDSELEKREESLVASRAVSSNFNVPCPAGLSLYPFQVAGVEYASKRFGVVLAKPQSHNMDHAQRNIRTAVTDNQSPVGRIEERPFSRDSSKSPRGAETQCDSGMEGKGKRSDQNRDASSRSSEETSRGAQACRFSSEGGERTAASTESAGIVQKALPVGVSTGVPHPHERPRHRGDPADKLQGGFRSPDPQDSCGSRRAIASSDEGSKIGQKENNRAECPRVDSCSGSALTEKGGASSPFRGGVYIADEMG